MPDGESERTIAACVSCGTPYAAKVWSDGTIQPIGTRTGCECGSTTFQVVEDSGAFDPQEEQID